MFMIFFKNEDGQSIVEYALVIGLIAIAAIAVLVAFSPKMGNIFNGANEAADQALAEQG